MAVPKARYEDLIRYIDFLNEGMERFEINTSTRIAAFIAQVAHESADFRSTEENLNYSWRAPRPARAPRGPRGAGAPRPHPPPPRNTRPLFPPPPRHRDQTGGGRRA